MTNTARVHVTLEESYMELIDELIEVWGASRPQVINNIIQFFFNDNHNDPLLTKLRARKRKIKPPTEEDLEKSIINIFKAADEIPFEDFINDLELDRKFVVSHFHEWAEKYGLQRKKAYIYKTK